MKTLILIFALLGTGCAQQVVIGGGAVLGGGVILNQPPAGPITGGQVTIPLTIVAKPQAYFYNSSATGLTFYCTGGTTAPLVPTTDPAGGCWYTNTAAVEANPAGATWTPMNHAAQSTFGGNYIPVRQILDVDSDRVVMINGFNGQSGNCNSAHSMVCTIQVYQISTDTYTLSTLPSLPSGQSFVCLARDSTNTFYSMTNYQGYIWKSPSGTPSGTWTLISSNYATLPGMSAGAGGNLYTCEVFGSKIYFSGEGGVMSCDLAFSACSEDYLPYQSGTSTAQRNAQALLSDVDAGSASTPSLIMESARLDSTIVANSVSVGRFSGGTWTGLSSSSGLPQFQNPAYFFDTGSVALGTSTSRRYYYMMGTAGQLNTTCYKSTTSTGTNWSSFYPASWPAGVPTSWGLLQIAGSSAGHMWAYFQGTSAIAQMWITP